MKCMTRNRRLTPEEAARYKAVRDRVAKELPDLIDRHHERMAALDEVDELLRQLRSAHGKGLEDVGPDRADGHGPLGAIQTGGRTAQNPTVATLVRYAQAVGKRLVVSLADV